MGQGLGLEACEIRAEASASWQQHEHLLHTQLGCGCSSSSGFGARVTDVSSRMATVRWRCMKDSPARKYHIILQRLPPSIPSSSAQAGVEREPIEIAFFETHDQTGIFKLPYGTLERACGPYQVQVVAESGTIKRPQFSAPATSAPFCTLPEEPGPVTGLRLQGEPAQREICITWNSPSDDGSSPIEEYRVVLALRPMAGRSDTLPRSNTGTSCTPLREVTDPIQHGGEPFSWTAYTQESLYELSLLAPGSGPYCIEVRAKNAAGLLGPPACMKTSTAVAKPLAPQRLRASLVSSQDCHGESIALADGSEWIGPPLVGNDGNADIQLVRLNFEAPTEDGGRQVETYIIYAVEELGADEDCPAVDAGHRSARCKGGVSNPRRLCSVAAADSRSASDEQCEYNVVVASNCAYTFYVAAFNGVIESALGEAAPPVSLPPTVPPRREPPVASAVDGGQTVELTWTASRCSGGLPLLLFRIGILGPGMVAEEDSALCIQRELSILATEGIEDTSCIDATEYGSPRAHLRRLHYKIRLEHGTLEAGMQYRFVIATCNRLGTGSWSRPSEPVWTPLTYCPIPALPLAVWQAIDLEAEDDFEPHSPGPVQSPFAMCRSPLSLDGQNPLPRIDSSSLTPLSQRECGT